MGKAAGKGAARERCSAVWKLGLTTRYERLEDGSRRKVRSSFSGAGRSWSVMLCSLVPMSVSTRLEVEIGLEMDCF